jgi:hypothetical protein
MADIHRYPSPETSDTINAIPTKQSGLLIRFDVTPHGAVVAAATSYDSYAWAASSAHGTLPAMYYHDINATLSFDGVLVSTGLPVTVAEWFWDFGDGTTAVGQSVTHIYRYANPTIAHLRATDTNGNQAWASMNLMLQGTNVNPVTAGAGVILA